MRTARIIVGVFALAWGFLQAPFDHIHQEEIEHRITSAPLHIHVHETVAGHAPSIGPHAADDVDLLWIFTTSGQPVIHVDAELGERIAVPISSLAAIGVLVPRHRGHDPPEFSPKIPRAPPA